MSMTESLRQKHEQVEKLRSDVASMREALDRTDKALAGTDEALLVAERTVEATRRYAPIIGVAIGVTVVGVVAFVVIRRRRARQHLD